MTQHPGKFVAEGPATAEKSAPGLKAVLDGCEPQQAQPSRKKHILRRSILAAAGALALTGAGYFGWQYWTVGRFEVSTDDAYVQADNTTIAPKVAGYLAAVLVGDNEPVKAGQTLARIDDRDYRVALEQAEADVASAKAVISTRQASLDAAMGACRTPSRRLPALPPRGPRFSVIRPRSRLQSVRSTY
jgi:membrane fusion protein (multidrug efflux system)